MPTANGLSLRAQSVLVVLGALYVATPFLLTFPYLQRHAIFMHALRWPLFADFDTPARYGLPTHRTVNLKIETSDNVHLGAWFVMPELPTANFSVTISANLLPSQKPTHNDVHESLATNPTIIFFHGNAASRAAYFRVQHYTSYVARFHANVLVIDYRGFADSEGTPSERGLQRDARAAWDWVINGGAEPREVLIMGQSLGTAVAAGLAAELAKQDVHPRGVVLLASFISVEKLLVDYNMFGFLPILKFMQYLPSRTSEYLTSFIRHRFDTVSVLNTIKAPVVLAHSQDDYDIPSAHSQNLFNNLLEPYLTPLPVLLPVAQMTPAQWADYNEILERRRVKKAQIVATQKDENFGTIAKFERGLGGVPAVFVETKWGGHDRVGIQGGVMDIIGRVFELGCTCK